MLYSFLISLIDQFSALNVFRYLTFRTGLSVMSSMIIVFLIGGPFIKFIESRKITGPIRNDGPTDHIIKKIGTPTMGGLLILIGILFGTLLWADLNNYYVWILLMVATTFGLLGFADDYLKIKHNNSRGISSGLKFFFQIILSLIVIFLLMKFGDSNHLKNLYFPFFKNLVLHLGLFFIPFALFIIVGSSNAVNLTDGLDGLATVPVMLVALSFTLICYVVGNTVFSEYLQISYIADVGEASIFCGSIVGSCLGFLWFNAPPAKIFMGDTGSLSLGGSLGVVSIISKHEIVLAIVGGLFVLETVSVVVQVVSFKLTGKRVFMMAPLHHHFEKKGWAESTVVIRFWIISIILALIGLATLKLR
ncbi:MAG: phospho-N-acetylmuramoyl-pentapeptide-transferase [Pelagibacteraceae bacterium]|nr:phospho-N-acetylmuramoyl-pentapeptide-transferase [Candidatus Pelagibacter sp.]MDP6680292.1 phospho-N-acetylmuramoyl-pentapeptide-transferase [Pelagibacteraceae bacterium]MDP6710370.1 phospho-N-acetylmuramoyl-pentapeptide-transferase [Pelagibacteraceae bacterium]